MTRHLEGRVALVTGASRGIGRAIAVRLAEAGARIAVNYHTGQEGAASTVAVIQEQGGEALAVGFDVGDPEAVRGGVQASIDGLGPIDILVNNAGVTHNALLLRTRTRDWDSVLRVNLSGAFHCAKVVARGMVRARRGRIINVTSVVGESGNAGQTAYAAAKAGIIGFTKAAARELAGRGITVNAVAPGLIETDMTEGLDDAQRLAYRTAIPMGREGTRSEVADAVAYLAGPGAAYVTGQVLRVNGGLYM